jgi:hypothetical protein
MTVESDLYAALAPMFGNRVYPDTAPDNAAAPYMTYQQVGGKSVSFLESGVVGKRNGLFQINIWGKTRMDVAALSRAVSDALVTNTALRATPMGEPIAEYEELVNLYGASQDFSIWFTS